MKRTIAAILLLPGLLSAPSVPAEGLKRVSGADWLLMTRDEKSQYVEGAIGSFRSKGVPIELPPGYYVNALDFVTNDPKSLRSDVANLIASLAYKKEPATRAALDEMRKRAQPASK